MDISSDHIAGASVDILLTATLMSIHHRHYQQYVIPIFLVAFSVTLFALALSLWFGRRTNYRPRAGALPVRLLLRFHSHRPVNNIVLFSTRRHAWLAFFNVGILVTCAPILCLLLRVLPHSRG